MTTTTTALFTRAAEEGTSQDMAAVSGNALSSVSPAPSRRAIWAGRIMSGIASLFLGFDAAMKLMRIPAALEGTAKVGYSPSVVTPLGLVQLVCLALYLVPRTAVLGAVLWTGYLGGAVATHVRVGDPVATHMLFPVYVAVLLWGGLWLRDGRVRALLPLRR